MSKKLIYLFVLVVFSATAISAIAADRPDSAKTVLNAKVENIKVELKTILETQSVPPAKMNFVGITPTMATKMLTTFQDRINNFIIKSHETKTPMDPADFYSKSIAPMLKKLSLDENARVKTLFNEWIANTTSPIDTLPSNSKF
ncbi:MAG: hypothetical protein A2161_15190 [Candidatus Schekmanbacteria bacterium RBG_13_48_7]|uniref:DUF2059 domain-containing protein n=1 Tax=Candidatus Schekmanbacteria bacterium RBG_13_48_7 TaxID=1817878 RepID=A0A1F7RWB1_9BACT|nr:MAG: hypothetical protein A2161_15190 [Candidatus Schekmanbacteria bacterium RBG_13_48_7]